jgi:hypothetical protein
LIDDAKIHTNSELAMGVPQFGATLKKRLEVRGEE